MTSKM